MSLYSLFEMDQNAETDGFLLNLQDGDLTVSFLIARAGGSNKKYTNRFQALMRPHQHAAQSGKMDEEVAKAILTKVMAETLILGWENVNDRNGDPIEFSVEECTKLLNDLPELRDMIWEQANRAANFIAVEREENAKN